MPTDGADFARRRPLYGQFYVALKNGADVARLASLASDGVARDIGQRPLVALKPAIAVVLSIANSTLFPEDIKRSLLVQETEKLKAQFAGFSSTRDTADCALRAGLEAVDQGVALSEQGAEYRLPEKLESSGMDSSQRTRSFVHISLGILSAVLVGHRQLFLFENGIGSLNLSCDHSQIGSQNSRGTHPVLLRYMSAFASAYFENSMTVANPFLFMTKGQMLAQPTMNGFEDLFQRSFSCDRFPNYHCRASQCGHCASCLIRRLSFRASSRPDDPSGCSFDIFSPRWPPRDREIFAFNKLSAQAEAIRARIGADEVWQSLSSEWRILILSDIEIGKPGFRDAVVELLKRHSIEWQNFSRLVEHQRLPYAA
jgi:Queuosine biosynthesis protein QueC